MEASHAIHSTATPLARIQIRRPCATDGRAVHTLIAQCPPLDGNSLYCNLLQCTHFAETSALAEYQGRVLGFVSGYIVPESQSNTLFIWQVAVHADARGRGLGRRMICEILDRDACADVDFVETTIGPDNASSWALFEGLAKQLRAGTRHETLFDRAVHFAWGHHSEIKFTIGPFTHNHSTTQLQGRYAR